MIEHKNHWKQPLAEFLFHFLIVEGLVLVGAYVLVKATFMYSLNLPPFGIVFEKVREKIEQITIWEFYSKLLSLFALLTFFSAVFAYGAMDDN